MALTLWSNLMNTPSYSIELTGQPSTGILEQRHWQADLKLIVEGIASQIGEEFFRACARYLAELLQIRYALIAEFLDCEEPRARVLAFWAGEDFAPNFDYDLAGTPCGVVIEEGLRIYSSGIQQHFPQDEDLVTMEAESYLGIAILNSQGKPLGHIAGLHTQPLKRSYEEQAAILKIFAARSAAEIERQLAERALKQQNLCLEETLKRLQQTQAQLIHAEKMSSLGQMVAGIAHEINNPISFIYGNLSHAQDYTETLLSLISAYQAEVPNPSKALQQKLQAADLEFLQQDLTNVLHSMQSGSDRIRNLVLSLRNFLRLDEADKKLVDLHEGIENALLIVHHRLQAEAPFPEIQIVRDYCQLPLVNCYASQLNQVFLHILVNAIDALRIDAIPDPTICITTKITPDQTVKVSIADNGPGMDAATQDCMFDPFFTTKPIGSGTGLGLSISYQIVVEQHGGKLCCVSAPGRGAKLVIEIPI